MSLVTFCFHKMPLPWMFSLVLLACASAGLASERRLIYSYNDSDRIVSTARFSSDYPYLVSLTSHGGSHHFCGGTLLDEHWILTAAHCFGTAASSVGDIQVRLMQASDSRTSQADLVVTHESFDMDVLNDDIALLRLATALPVAKYAKLEDRSRRHVGSKALLAGWGTLDEWCFQVDDVLREGDTYIAGDGACRDLNWAFNWSEVICTTHINATDKAVAGAGCGDSGGPLFLLENGELVQVGIVSFSQGGRDQFTRVFTYTNWINNVLQSPPTQSQMVLPRCFNSCCDDPDHLDSYGATCDTWKGYDCLAYPFEVGLLQKCAATCLQCPLCEATNTACCDVGGYLDAEGYACSSWIRYDCTNYAGFSSAELADLQSNCPLSCGLCSPGTDCTNNEGWLDEKGYDCHSWQGYDCSQAATFGYSHSGRAAAVRFKFKKCLQRAEGRKQEEWVPC
eukprot:Skav212675  [mRNA]  locus=scaffold1227:830280:832126:- [translate_table: standard]